MKESLHILNSFDELNKLKEEQNPEIGFADDYHVSLIEFSDDDFYVDYHPLYKASEPNNSLDKKAWGLLIKSPVDDDYHNWELIGNRDLYNKWKSGEANSSGHPLGRYLLLDDGTAKKLYPADSRYLLNSDGSKGDTILNWDGSLKGGQIMVYLPDLYYKVESTPDGYTCLWMSGEDIGGHKLDASMISAFNTSIDKKATKPIAYSVPIERACCYSIAEVFNATTNKGPDYNIMSYDQWKYLVLLHLAEFGSPNIQETIGGGAFYTYHTTGETLQLGDSSGYIKKEQVTGDFYAGVQSFLGIEGLINKYVTISGALNHTDGIYLYPVKAGSKIALSKSDVLKYYSDSYRLIESNQVISTSKSKIIKHIVGGEYFDIFASNGADRLQSSDYLKYWSDLQKNLCTLDDRLITLFGSIDGLSNKSNAFGLLTCFGDGQIYMGGQHVGSRYGYFGKIKFIS